MADWYPRGHSRGARQRGWTCAGPVGRMEPHPTKISLRGRVKIDLQKSSGQKPVIPKRIEEENDRISRGMESFHTKFDGPWGFCVSLNNCHLPDKSVRRLGRVKKSFQPLRSSYSFQYRTVALSFNRIVTNKSISGVCKMKLVPWRIRE